MRTLDFPYRFDSHGRTATTGAADHVRDLIEQVLLTSPGERLMRPDFGGGLSSMVFEPNDVTRAASMQVLVLGSLQQHLSDVATISEVLVESVDALLQVTVRFTLPADGTSGEMVVRLPGGGA